MSDLSSRPCGIITPTLNGPGVRLRPWQPVDAEWYVAARDQEVIRWTSEHDELSVPEARAAMVANRDHPNNVCLAIEDTGRSQLAGNIALRVRDSEAEIMYFLAASGRGRGLATRSVRVLCRWAFAELRLTRIWLKMKRGNRRSRAVAQRVGFHRCRAPRSSRLSYYEIRRGPEGSGAQQERQPA